MKRFLMKVLAIIVPWLVLLIYDNPGGAFIALVLQATAIGWLPASAWALKLVNEREPKKTKPPKTPNPPPPKDVTPT